MATDDATAIPTAADEARSHREHRRIQRLLQIGLAIGAAAMLAGLLVAAIGAAIRGEPIHRGGAGSTIARAGILALALTPVARVAALSWLWLRERDWRFAAVGAFVLLVLVAAIVTGRGV